MAQLGLTDCLREARSLPVFDGESKYSLQNYLRDVTTVLSLTEDSNKAIVQTILANKIQGRALNAVETLTEPTWTNILNKLRQEFGVKESYFSIREEAMNLNFNNIEELHYKLDQCLNKMNTKYSLEIEKDVNFTPANNVKLIFDIYINYLSLNIKALLLQNNISSVSSSRSFLIENNLMSEAILSAKHYKRNNSVQQIYRRENVNRNINPNQNNHNFLNRNYNSNFNQSYPRLNQQNFLKNVDHSRSNFNRNVNRYSGNFYRNPVDNRRVQHQVPMPMEIDHAQYENFPQQPQAVHYQ